MDMAQSQLKEMLRLMYTIRGFELKAQDMFREGLAAGQFLGALHSYEGQEAVAVGVCACLNRDDYVLSSHRGHGHFLAKGGDMRVMMAELLGKETGASQLGLASLWSLPVVYVCENNLWAATTPITDGWAVEDLAPRAESFGMPGLTVDGNDLLAVRDAAAEAVARARSGDGPTLIEAKTYRHRPHCMIIPEHRDEDELAMWRERDPIPRFENYLREGDLMTEAEMQGLRDAIDAELQAAVEFAKASPLPDPSAYAEYLWA
jgi:pyruvate dehydrogenase E1 component alpha subunit